MIVDDFTDWVGCRRAVADFRLVRGIDAQQEPIQVSTWEHKDVITIAPFPSLRLFIVVRMLHRIWWLCALCSSLSPSNLHRCT